MNPTPEFVKRDTRYRLPLKADQLSPCVFQPVDVVEFSTTNSDQTLKALDLISKGLAACLDGSVSLRIHTP